MTALPDRAPTLAELLEWVDGAAVAELCSKDKPVLSLTGSHQLLRDGRGVPSELVVNLSMHHHGAHYGDASLSISRRDPNLYVLPYHLGWKNDGTPVLSNPVSELYDAIVESYRRIHNWLTPWYLSAFMPKAVTARIADQLQGDIIRFIQKRTITVAFPAATSLLYIEPYPARLSKYSEIPAERQFHQQVKAIQEAVKFLGDRIDVAACSQSKPLHTASIAVGGRSVLVTSVPFNGRYLPQRRSGIVRSIHYHPPVINDRWRVTVEGMQRSPFEQGSVRLLTAFAKTPWNSLDSQAITQSGAKKLDSYRTERVRVTNPIVCRVSEEDVGRIVHHSEVLLVDHEGVDQYLDIPENAYPLEMNAAKGCARISNVTFTKTHHSGVYGEVVEVEYTFVHPAWVGDKAITPHSAKGVLNVVDFEAEAWLGGKWVPIEVISDGGQNDLADASRKPKGLEKRGTAVALHGRLELACELTKTTCKIPVNADWTKVGKHLPTPVRRMYDRADPILTGRVPVRIKDEDGNWETFRCEVGLVPWIRTKNSIDITVEDSDDAMPIHAITYASCLRKWKKDHPTDTTLMDWFLDGDLTPARALLDVLCTPCVKRPLEGKPFTLLQEDGSVIYRGNRYTPTKLTAAVHTVGDMSMEVLLPHEHPKNTMGLRYEGSILDFNAQEQGAVLQLRLPVRLPSGKLVSYLYFPKEFCKEYLSPRTIQPVTGRSIISAVANWLNAWVEIQDPKKDPRGTRSEQIPSRLLEFLVADLSSRRGLITRLLHKRKKGVRYVNLALDACPPGVMWMSEKMRCDLQNLYGRHIPYGSMAVDVRFPVEPETGIQAYEIAPMPKRLHADIVTNSGTSEDCQDGDNDGDGKMACVPPVQFELELRSMVDRREHEITKLFSPSTFEVRALSEDRDTQIEEASSTGAIKAEIGPVSRLQYDWMLSESWENLPEETISDVNLFWSAVLHSAVKKDLDRRLTWPLQRALYRPEPRKTEAIVEELRSLFRHKSPQYVESVVRGFRHVVEFRRKNDTRALRSRLVSMATVNAPAGGAPELLKGHLQAKTPDVLLEAVMSEIIFGGVR